MKSKILDRTQVHKNLDVLFVGRFVTSLVLPLLGTPGPAMWNILFEGKGAKARVHAHMLTFTLK